MSTPVTFAGPLLGGAEGRHLGRPDAAYRQRTSALALALLGLTILAGVLRQAPCLSQGYAIPHASYRMCASPIANALSDVTFPQTSGRSLGLLAAMSPMDMWFVSLGAPLGSVSGAMGILLIVNAVAFAIAGVAMLRLFIKKQWLAVVFFSPVVFFSLGQSLDPVGLAAVLVAVVLVLHHHELSWAAPVAGALLAVGMLVNPLAVLAGLALLLHLRWTGRMSEALVITGSATIVLGIMSILDGRLFTRFASWLDSAVDRGSLASIVARTQTFNDSFLTAVCVLALGGAIVWTILKLEDLSRQRSANGPAIGVAVPAALFLGWAVLLLPSGTISHALWLLPFAAAVVQKMWVHFCWMLAEAAMFIATQLGDAYTIEQAKGLSPTWVAIFTVLKLAAVALIVVLAARNPGALPFKGSAASADAGSVCSSESDETGAGGTSDSDHAPRKASAGESTITGGTTESGLDTSADRD